MKKAIFIQCVIILRGVSEEIRKIDIRRFSTFHIENTDKTSVNEMISPPNSRNFLKKSQIYLP